jgi:hypothetical protein
VVSATADLRKRLFIFVGCSWGAAVIDYALTHGARQALSLPGGGIAIGGPRHLFAPSSPLRPCLLSDNGDYRDLWVQRHPYDPIGKRGLGRYCISATRGCTTTESSRLMPACGASAVAEDAIHSENAGDDLMRREGIDYSSVV